MRSLIGHSGAFCSRFDLREQAADFRDVFAETKPFVAIRGQQLAKFFEFGGDVVALINTVDSWRKTAAVERIRNGGKKTV